MEDINETWLSTHSPAALLRGIVKTSLLLFLIWMGIVTLLDRTNFSDLYSKASQTLNTIAGERYAPFNEAVNRVTKALRSH